MIKITDTLYYLFSSKLTELMNTSCLMYCLTNINNNNNVGTVLKVCLTVFFFSVPLQKQLSKILDFGKSTTN